MIFQGMSGFSMRPGSVMQGTVTSSAQGPSPIPYAQSPQGQVRLHNLDLSEVIF